MTDSKKKRPYLQCGLTAAVLIGLVVAAARYLNGAEVLRGLMAFNYALMPLMLALSTGDLLLKAWRFVLLLHPVSAVRGGVTLNLVILDLSLLRGLGETLSYPTLFLAFFLPTMFGRIFPLPGGIGVTEAGMVGFLASTSAIDVDTAAAAVTIFRVVAVPYSAALGALVYFLAWRGEEEAVATPLSQKVKQHASDAYL